MSVKVVPAQEILTCDRCKQSGERYKTGPFQSAGTHIRDASCWAIGYGGDIGGLTMSFDFCGRCWEEMIKKPVESHEDSAK